MGTRADFYVGKGESATWLGSVAYDGRQPEVFRGSATEKNYRKRVAAWMKDRDDATHPVDGWPWPWKDSCLTDVAYTFDEGKVWMTDYAKEPPKCEQCGHTRKPWIDLHEELRLGDARTKRWKKVQRDCAAYFAKRRPTTSLQELEETIAKLFPYEDGPEPVHHGWACFPLFGGTQAATTLGPRSGILLVKF